MNQSLSLVNIKANNFKSLVDFSLPFSKFNCLVGLNGSGKSTVLQFIDFLSQQVSGDIDEWLESRQWNARDLNSTLTPKSNITFMVELSYSGNPVIWEGSFNRTELYCTAEKITWGGKVLLNVADGKFSLPAEGLQAPITFDYQGSILSQLRENQLPKELVAFKTFFNELNALDMLSPEMLRDQHISGKTLGAGGKMLSSFISNMTKEEKANLVATLKELYPSLVKVDATVQKSAGTVRLEIEEKFGEKIIKTEARHINDGLLRFMAIFAQLTKKQSALLLDEIENGVNPELIEKLVDSLVEANTQVIVTTHSPMILNYMEDDVAKKGVVYLYKNKAGATQAIRLFDIPSMQRKLKFMGPGEAYEDTILENLAPEAATVQLISN
ncbi:chromosome segregation protein SMC [Vibrio parahaemolyticus]|nr:chromosome segregation protein SMC [Vibrio parahaemolyticus]EHH1171782.1 AAA family ATPase [Vibrio parahaemolyticus]EJS9605368.1 AAA family ATPase [Vibrio parahaemolyticus]TOD60779.1 chromosome segregation protein SMC [Vibrio parahaemolyticus]TOL16688.1 chromosome segregation protein SMC [Vibrio parahaemolyticus]